MVGLQLDIRGGVDDDVGLRGAPDVAPPGVAVEVTRLGDPDGRTLPGPRPLHPFPRPGLGVLDELLPEDQAVSDIAPFVVEPDEAAIVLLVLLLREISSIPHPGEPVVLEE